MLGKIGRRSVLGGVAAAVGWMFGGKAVKAAAIADDTAMPGEKKAKGYHLYYAMTLPTSVVTGDSDRLVEELIRKMSAAIKTKSDAFKGNGDQDFANLCIILPREFESLERKLVPSMLLADAEYRRNELGGLPLTVDQRIAVMGSLMPLDNIKEAVVRSNHHRRAGSPLRFCS